MNVAATFVVMTATVLSVAPDAIAQTSRPSAQTATDTPALVTDRPDFTESSEVVGHGTVQLETGFTLESDRAEGVGTRSISTPALLVRIGAGSRLELRLGSDGFVHGWTTGASNSGVSGYADVDLGAKLKVLALDAFDMAVIPIVSIPTHDNHYSSGTFDATVKVAWATTLPRDFGLSGNVNVSRPSDPQGRFTQQAISLSLGHDIAHGWGAYGEAYAFTPMERGVGAGWTVNTGVTRSLGDDMQLDVEVGRGVTTEAPNWFVGFGFVARSR